MAHLDPDQIRRLGFASVGRNVRLSDKASFYNCPNISLGDNVRIDDFCVLSAGVGGIAIGSFVHVAVYTSLIGAGRITLSDFCNVSSRVAIYSSSDDYSGSAMTNPMIPAEFTNVTHADVWCGEHVIIGAGSIILPGARLERGVAIGALTLVKGNCEEFGVYFGTPAERKSERKRDLLQTELRFRAWLTNGQHQP